MNRNQGETESVKDYKVNGRKRKNHGREKKKTNRQEKKEKSMNHKEEMPRGGTSAAGERTHNRGRNTTPLGHLPRRLPKIFPLCTKKRSNHEGSAQVRFFRYVSGEIMMDVI